MVSAESKAPSRIGCAEVDTVFSARDRHVFSNTVWQWTSAGLIYAALFGAAFEYHLVRANPVSWFTANKCLGIAAVISVALALAIGPLSRLTGMRLAGLLPWRRSLGVVGAVATVPHVALSLFAFPDKFPWEWYAARWLSITLAGLSIVVLVVLVVYSWPRGFRQLGPELWLRLHKLSWLALGLALGHVLLLGKVPGWLKWLETFDKPLPPGALMTTALVLCVLVLKAFDMAAWRLKREPGV
jgi:DMSO/TMAO reductase YedYZ heme-binding membrane subunit